MDYLWVYAVIAGNGGRASKLEIQAQSDVIPPRTLARVLSLMCKQGILVKPLRGHYELNPSSAFFKKFYKGAK